MLKYTKITFHWKNLIIWQLELQTSGGERREDKREGREPAHSEYRQACGGQREQNEKHIERNLLQQNERRPQRSQVTCLNKCCEFGR